MAPEVVGTVQEVDFREYVATTMAVEWPEHYPLETLKAGAVATKQFAWYHVIHPRGGRGATCADGTQACYDVVDTTIDQYYYPEKYGVGKPDGPGRKIMAALDETWDVTVRKYRPATPDQPLLPDRLSGGQPPRSAGGCQRLQALPPTARGPAGRTDCSYREILRRYLSPNLEIVTAGRHDVVGSRHGDAGGHDPDAEGQQVAHVWPSGESAAGAGSRAGLRISGEDLVGYASGDVDDDGRDDLVWLLQTGPRTGQLRVALSDGSSYGGEQVWYDGAMLVALGGAKLLIGDFHADGRTDVAVLGSGESEGSAQLVVLKKKPGDGFAATGTLVVRTTGHGHRGGGVGGRPQWGRSRRPHPARAPRERRGAHQDGRHRQPVAARPAAHGQPAQHIRLERSIRPRSRWCRATPTGMAGRTPCPHGAPGSGTRRAPPGPGPGRLQAGPDLGRPEG